MPLPTPRPSRLPHPTVLQKLNARRPALYSCPLYNQEDPVHANLMIYSDIVIISIMHPLA